MQERFTLALVSSKKLGNQKGRHGTNFEDGVVSIRREHYPEPETRKNKPERQQKILNKEEENGFITLLFSFLQ